MEKIRTRWLNDTHFELREVMACKHPCPQRKQDAQSWGGHFPCKGKSYRKKEIWLCGWAFEVKELPELDRILGLI